MVLGRVRLGRAQTFRERDEHDADGRRRRGEVVAQAQLVRQPDRREPALDVADDRDAVLAEIEEVHDTDAEHDRDQRRRHGGREPAQHQDDRERQHADHERAPLRVAEMA